MVGAISHRQRVSLDHADACCSAHQDESALDVTAETAKAAATTAMDNAKSFIAGGFGGASAVLVGTRWPSTVHDEINAELAHLFRDF